MIATSIALNLLFSLTLMEVTPSSLHFSCSRTHSTDNVCYSLDSSNEGLELIYEFNNPYLAENNENGYVYLDLSLYNYLIQNHPIFMS